MQTTSRLSLIEDYATAVLANDTSGHSMDHIQRVVQLAQRLGEAEDCDLFLVLAGAYLHDVMDDKLVPNVSLAREELTDFLKELQLSASEIAALFEVIDHVSFSKSLENPNQVLSLEAQIVQDADRLDAIGAIGIARTFYYGGHAGHKLYDPNILPREQMTKAEYRVNQTVINHFYEKLLLLPERLNRPLAREIGAARQTVMLEFLTAFKNEWAGQ